MIGQVSHTKPSKFVIEWHVMQFTCQVVIVLKLMVEILRLFICHLRNTSAIESCNTFEHSVKLELSTQKIYFYNLITKTFFTQLCDIIIVIPS